MSHTLVVRGHVVGSNTVEVDEPIPPGTTAVEVVLHLTEKPPARRLTLGQYIRQLPPGTRSKEDIDRQIQEERDSWRD